MPLAPDAIAGADLIVDALFGAGLDRPLEAPRRRRSTRPTRRGVPVLAVDLPSGIDGRPAQVLGTAIRATRDGDLLPPEARACSSCPAAATRDASPSPTSASTLGMLACDPRRRPSTISRRSGWTLPRSRVDGHKYDRGHAVVVSGPSDADRRGAARGARSAARRRRAGHGRLAAGRARRQRRAADRDHARCRWTGRRARPRSCRDRRRNAVVLGPASASAGYARRWSRRRSPRRRPSCSTPTR